MIEGMYEGGTATCPDCGLHMPWDAYDDHMNREHRPLRQMEVRPSKFDEAVALVFQEACNRFIEQVRESGQHDPNNKFFLATNVIQDAWPDVIARMYPERALRPT